MAAASPVLFLVDGYALIYRAFFALIARPLTTSRGEFCSAGWGVTIFLIGLVAQHAPDYLGWVHDRGVSFRAERYPAYKATRQKLDEELEQVFTHSVERIESLLAAFRVPVLGVEGYEADDVIGTLAQAAVARGLRVVIVSGDKDFYQLIGPSVALLNPGRGGPAAVDEHWVDERNARERFGVAPAQVVDFLALVGDSSDNVPGVRGVGEKTALALLEQYGTLDGVLAHAAEIPGKRAREAVMRDVDLALLSRELVTIRRDVPIELDLEALRVRPPEVERLAALLDELEFRSLVPKLASLTPAPRVAPLAPVDATAPSAPGAQAVVVDEPAALAAVLAHCRRAPIVALDTETSSVDPMRAELVGLSLATADGSWYLPFAHVAPDGELGAVSPQNLPPFGSSDLADLRALLADPAVPKAGHNIKYDWLVLRRAGAELGGVAYDSILASFVLDPGRRSHALDELARDRLGVALPSYADLVGRGRAERPFAAVGVQDAARYCCGDSETVLRLRAAFSGELDDHELGGLLATIEMPLVSVLVGMEWRGVLVDRSRLGEIARLFARELIELEAAISRAAGVAVNLNSTPQLRTILFEKLQLPVLKRTKTGASTDFEVLERLAAMGHEVPRLLIEYRELSKLKSTYVDALPGYVNPATGRIHTSFNQTGAATGRLSSSEPNLQNIPIRTPRGEAIRRAFVAPAGAVLLTADYSQIELRLLAHLSGDPAFVQAFIEGGDIHRQTAALIFGVAQDAVTGEMRARAKTINFGTIYGQGPVALSRLLGIPLESARRFIDEYFARFAGVRAWLDGTIASARERGYVETIFGRRRYIPELRDRNANIRAFGERTATNSPLQGSAADLIKLAMIQIDQTLAREGLDAHMLLQVHDELVFEVGAAAAERVGALVRAHMEGAATLRVPLLVTIGTGPNWVDAKT